MTVIHITPGPSILLGSADDDRDTRWCFNCRQHLPHFWELWGDPPGSYYGPVPVIRCSRCKRDHTVHPGSYRDGPAYPSDAVWKELSR